MPGLLVSNSVSTKLHAGLALDSVSSAHRLYLVCANYGKQTQPRCVMFTVRRGTEVLEEQQSQWFPVNTNLQKINCIVLRSRFHHRKTTVIETDHRHIYHMLLGHKSTLVLKNKHVPLLVLTTISKTDVLRAKCHSDEADAPVRSVFVKNVLLV